MANKRRNLISSVAVPRRREINNETLSKSELAELRQRLADMKASELEIYYQARHNACRYTGVRVPAPCAVQEFVQAWKQLRRIFGKQARGGF